MHNLWDWLRMTWMTGFSIVLLGLGVSVTARVAQPDLAGEASS